MYTKEIGLLTLKRALAFIGMLFINMLPVCRRDVGVGVGGTMLVGEFQFLQVTFLSSVPLGFFPCNLLINKVPLHLFVVSLFVFTQHRLAFAAANERAGKVKAVTKRNNMLLLACRS